MERLLIGARELAQMLGRGEKAIYHDVFRQNWHRVPQPLRLGRELAWSVAGVREWVAERVREAQGGAELGKQEVPRRRRGRPTKAEQAAHRAGGRGK